MQPRTVSLCIIAYNEEKHLPALLSDIKKQTWPKDQTQIVLTDGASTDATKRIMQEFADQNRADYLDIKVLDNPKRIQSSGWNTAIRAALCDVIIRIDAHARIPSDFTEKNMRCQMRGEMITGGVRPCIMEEDTPWKRTLLLVENSLFGSSIGRKNAAEGNRYVKSFFHAAYRREVFEKAGLFNEKLLRTEDNELHYRMRQAGYRFCLDPKIISWQIARPDLMKMIRQKYANGYWIGTTLKVCPGCLSAYHLAPAAFLVGIAATGVLAGFGFWQFAAVMWGLYLAFAVISTIFGCKEVKPAPQMLLSPFLFLILHLAYGAGTFIGLICGREYVAA